MVQNKKTAAELKNELYIATLIEKHQKENTWLTTIEKEKFDTNIEIVKQSKHHIRKEAISFFEESYLPLYRENDALLYLLLKSSMSNVGISRLNEQELECAKEMIIAEMEYDPDQLSIKNVVERLSERYCRPVIAKEEIKNIIEDKCCKGIHCFEPFSTLFVHSEKLNASREEMIVAKCFYTCILSDKNIEDIASFWDDGCSPKDYPGMSLEESELQHEKEVRKAADVFVARNKMHLVNENGFANNPWQYANEDKYESVLISCLISSESAFVPLLENFLDIEAIREHVNDDGYIFVIWDKDFMRKMHNSNSVLGEKLDKFKESLACHPELDAYIPDSGLGDTEIYILKKGKKDQNVSVFFSVHNTMQNDYLNLDHDFLQCRSMSHQDLAAIGYDLSKVSLMPTIHVSEGETYHTLSELLEPSKDEYVRREQTATGKVFSPDNYATSFDTFVVSPASLREAQVDDKWKKVTEPVFVLRRSPFAVAFVEATAEVPVYFKTMTMTFSVKEDVIDRKFLYFLSINGKLEQLVLDCPDSLFQIGEYPLYKDERNVTYVGYWPAKSLLYHNGLIAIPDKEEQLRLISDTLISQMHEKQESSFEQFKKEIHKRKHALTPVVTDIQKRWNVLQKYITKNGGVLNLEDSIGIENPVSVAEWNSQITQDLDVLTKRTKRLADEPAEIGAEFGAATSFALQRFIEKYIECHRPDGYTIVTDETISICPNVLFSESGLERILDNIVRNAVSHGFEPNRKNIILLKVHTNDDYVVLSVCNNGHPIANGLTEEDILSWGRSSNLGKDGHEGIGGNEVKNIISFYGGHVNVLSMPQDEYTVEYQLHIPQSYE